MTEVAEGSDSVELRPLLRRDPPAVGDIRLIGRIGDHDAGMTYIGRLMLDDTLSEPAPDGDDTTSMTPRRVGCVLFMHVTPDSELARETVRPRS